MTTETRQPQPSFPPQWISPPSVEHAMNVRPKILGAQVSRIGKAEGPGRPNHRRRFRDRSVVAMLFAREGADCAILYLSEREDAEETKRAVEKEGRRVILIEGDVPRSGVLSKSVERTVAKFGKLDLLINNAAYQQHTGGLDEITDEQFDRIFKTNIYGYFHMAKAALPHLKRGAAIVNKGSIKGLEGSAGQTDYSSTKGAVHAFTKSLAQSLVKQGIRVNCVASGPVWTPRNPAEREYGDVKDFSAEQPLGRPAQPEEIAPAFVFFASNVDSGYVTGEVLTLLGGQTVAG